MPALSPITVLDRQTVPVAHVFEPNGSMANGVHSFIQTDGVPIGDSLLTVSSRKTSANKTVVLWRLAVPVTKTETVNGIDSEVVIRTAYAECKFTFDESSTLAERQDTAGKIESLIKADNALSNAIITQLQKFY